MESGQIDLDLEFVELALSLPDSESRHMLMKCLHAGQPIFLRHAQQTLQMDHVTLTITKGSVGVAVVAENTPHYQAEQMVKRLREKLGSDLKLILIGPMTSLKDFRLMTDSDLMRMGLMWRPDIAERFGGMTEADRLALMERVIAQEAEARRLDRQDDITEGLDRLIEEIERDKTSQGN